MWVTALFEDLMVVKMLEEPLSIILYIYLYFFISDEKKIYDSKIMC